VASVVEFLQDTSQRILGHLVQGQTGDVTGAQRQAWLQQIEILKAAIPVGLDGTVCFEVVIPRIGKRADNVLLIGDQVVVIEFKVGSSTYDLAAQRQVVDYALDLRNFHQGSVDSVITPVLVATHAPAVVDAHGSPYDGVYPVVLANRDSLAQVFNQVTSRADLHRVAHDAWLQAGYRPTPTIVEASQALYRGHGVTEITHSEAGADNLGATTVAIATAIDQARTSNQKVICLVSGVPGAGKTLAGLNLVCQRRRTDAQDQEHAVFLSGNGPLVKVLQEALARDEVKQAADRGERANKLAAHRKAVAFIQNIHHFRDESLRDLSPPVERVVVFDEAQRAWDRTQASKFMRQKRAQPQFNSSEPEFLIGVMDRHLGWAVIVCLIGGGQEINTGEAGLEEWLRALRDHFPDWRVYLPNQLDSADYLPTFDLQDLGTRVTRLPSLHLSVSLRSFRSERLSAGISALMSADSARAFRELGDVLPRFPIVITRSLAAAKGWARTRARGSERYGLLASSGGKRLKPLGINMDVQVDPCLWFLNADTDVRSSYYLEDAASEFDVQGLELDWTIVVWDGDLIHQTGGWGYRAFKGTRWQEIHDEGARRYRLNAYRVLLTRARQGMVIVVPEGDAQDPTRSPTYYDPTWRYLHSAGLPELT
jgi:hypothetical protein